MVPTNRRICFELIEKNVELGSLRNHSNGYILIYQTHESTFYKNTLNLNNFSYCRFGIQWFGKIPKKQFPSSLLKTFGRRQIFAVLTAVEILKTNTMGQKRLRYK